MDELLRLGISCIWVGLESPQSKYAKLKNADTCAIVSELRSHGIKLLGSAIVRLEHRTPQNIQADIDHAVSHGTDFHQFPKESIAGHVRLPEEPALTVVGD